jgi:PAS domain S-box-containing protein
VVYASMEANTALAFVLSGLGLCGLTASHRWWNRLGQTLGGVSALVGALTLFEFLIGRGLGIDQLLALDRVGVAFPGRMAPITAASFAAMGFAIASVRARSIWPSQAMAGMVAAVGFMAMVGYVYEASSLYAFGRYGSITAHTALAFVILAAGVIAARQHDGLMSLISKPSPGGDLTRRLLPAALLLPVLLGWLRLLGERGGWYNTAVGFALLAVVLSVTFILLTIQSAVLVDRANALQRHAERGLAAIVNASHDAIISVSLEGTIQSWNSGAERLYGYTATEAIGQSVRLIVPADRQDEFSGILASIAAGGSGVTSLETIRVTKAGRLVDVSSTVSPIRSPTGEIVGASSAARDVTEQRQIEERFRLAVEASTSGITLTDATGRIVLVNGKVERMFGYERHELVGQRVELLVPDRNPACGRRKDGSEFPAEIGLNPLETREGPLTLSVIVDISERQAMLRKLEEQAAELQRSNDELMQFAYVASHDLQEPLRMVSSYTELLGSRYRGQLDERADKYIRHIMDGATRMQQLIRDLLDFARVGRQARPKAPVDLHNVAQRVVRDLKPLIDASQAEIVIQPLPTVMSDDLQMGQVLQNLIGNAIKFRGEQPPRVIVAAEREGNAWRVSVEDNGIGIDMRFRDRVFEIFQRLHERGTYDGTGVGLAVVKRIVEQHGGRVWFESTPGQGTRFSFTIPTM